MGLDTETQNRKIDDFMDKLHPVVSEIQSSLDRYILYMITVSLLKISIGDSHKIEAVLDQWLNGFFTANVDIVGAKVAEIFGEESIAAENPDIAPMHLLALQSVTSVARKTLTELLEAVDLLSEGDNAFERPPSFNH